jgi:hypothetical protein
MIVAEIYLRQSQISSDRETESHGSLKSESHRFRDSRVALGPFSLILSVLKITSDAGESTLTKLNKEVNNEEINQILRG